MDGTGLDADAAALAKIVVDGNFSILLEDDAIRTIHIAAEASDALLAIHNGTLVAPSRILRRKLSRRATGCRRIFGKLLGVLIFHKFWF